MTRIESEKALVKKPAQDVYGFLSDFNHFEKLMPPQVTNWKSDKDQCSFTISGMASLEMAFEQKTPPSHIKIAGKGKSPFPFYLHCNMTPADSKNSSYLQLALEAELNPMLKMMAEKPLANFLNLLVKRYAEISQA